MSIIANVISIASLSIESLIREMSKAPIYEVKRPSDELVVENNLCITYQRLFSYLEIFSYGLKGNPFSLKDSPYTGMMDAFFLLSSTNDSFMNLKASYREQFNSK